MIRFINGEKRLVKSTSDGSTEPLFGKYIATFNEDIAQAFVVLRGWRLKFTTGDDQHYSEAVAKVDVENPNVNGREVIVRVTLGLRDKKKFDDPFEGIVYFTVVGTIKAKITEMTIRYG